MSVAKQKLMDDQVKHLLFRKELEKPENEILSNEMAETLYRDYTCTVRIRNFNCYEKPNHYLVKIYLEHNYSRPVEVYMNKINYRMSSQ